MPMPLEVWTTPEWTFSYLTKLTLGNRGHSERSCTVEDLGGRELSEQGKPLMKNQRQHYWYSIQYMGKQTHA